MLLNNLPNASSSLKEGDDGLVVVDGKEGSILSLSFWIGSDEAAADAARAFSP